MEMNPEDRYRMALREFEAAYKDWMNTPGRGDTGRWAKALKDCATARYDAVNERQRMEMCPRVPTI